ncbi:MAG: transposase, partial [Methylobacter sp.]|nr:transposase [Methylobacter sp.]
MPLSDTAIKNAKPTTDKAYKMPNEKGMYLLVHQNGSKYFRLEALTGFQGASRDTLDPVEFEVYNPQIEQMITIHQLLDNAKCFETVRALRWPEAVNCPHCGSDQITRQGKDDTQPERQRYGCKGCQRKFDDLTDTVFAGHHQPLKIWVLCL